MTIQPQLFKYHKTVTILILVDSFLQYGNCNCKQCHNPYFSRQFSAIMVEIRTPAEYARVTILILVDSFLQFRVYFRRKKNKYVTILILVDSFLQQEIKKIYNYAYKSQSLFQQIVFCNKVNSICFFITDKKSQSLFQQIVFCNKITI